MHRIIVASGFLKLCMMGLLFMAERELIGGQGSVEEEGCIGRWEIWWEWENWRLI